ncbi:MAG: HlyD family secretion protein [Bradyrhizobium sp.]|nr:MAG: HlyD family secretion protein [Bradyrhizobium sp.]
MTMRYVNRRPNGSVQFCGFFAMSQSQAQAIPLARAPAPALETENFAPKPAAAPTSVQTAPAGPARKRSTRSLLLGAAAILAIGYGVYWGYNYLIEGRFLVSTDDAYVGASTAVIAAKIAAHVVEVDVAANQAVRTGDLLARLDDSDYRLAVEAAKAKIATQDATIERIGRQVDAQGPAIAQASAQLASTQAQVKSAQADQTRYALEYDRSQKLAEASFGSQQRLEQAAGDRARTEAAVAGAQAAEQGAEAALSGAKQAAEVLKAQQTEAIRVRAELVVAQQTAERNLSFTEIRAPFDGIVGNKAIEVGLFAQPGTRLMALVPLQSAYVDANFKETQLAGIRPGEKVDLAVDSLDGHTVEGTVASISPASGSEFSLLPPDNATGNFTKVVQRIAVRIAIPPDVLAKQILRPGLSVVATIHTRDDSQGAPSLLSMLGLAPKPTEATAAQ